MKPVVIGISGSFSSGQDTLARFLRDTYRFVWVSTSDMVREEAMKRYNSVERPDMHNAATYLREAYGGGILVERAYEWYKKQRPGRGLILSGIRSLGEMNAIVDKGGIILYTDANPDLRYKRMVARHRDGESKLTEKGFLAREQSEWYTGSANTDFNRRDIRAYAEAHNTILWNDNDTEAFFNEAVRLLNLSPRFGTSEQII